MTQLVFWTAFNTFQSEKLLRGKPQGTPHPVTTREWTIGRSALWMRYTLQSILRQSVRNWLYVVLLDPTLRHMTDTALPQHIDPRVIYCYEDSPILMRLRQYDEILMALIDGDDLYGRHAGAAMLACPAKWTYFRHGYCLDQRTREVWHYDTIGTGPFFGQRLDPKELLAFDRDKRHPNHKAVAELNPTELGRGHFCVMLHDINTSSHPAMRYVKRDRPVPPEKLTSAFGGLVP